MILKATKVEGIYTADPVKDPTATRFDCITYQEVLEKQLKVMDASAISLCMDNNLPIVVFNMRTAGNILRVVEGVEGVGTHVCKELPEAVKRSREEAEAERASAEAARRDAAGRFEKDLGEA